MKQSASYIVIPIATMSTYTGLGMMLIGAGIGLYRGKDVAATALALGGFGILIGLVIIGPWWAARATGESAKPAVYAKEVRTGPVKIMWPKNGINRNEMGLVRFESVDYNEMSKIAAFVVTGNNGISVRALTRLLGDRATPFINELLATKWIEWKSWDHRGNPNKTQGVEVTDRGITGFTYYLQQTPPPRYDD